MFRPTLDLGVSVALPGRVSRAQATTGGPGRLPAKHAVAAPEGAFLDVAPLGIAGGVAQGRVDTAERLDVRVLALEVRQEVELSRTLVAVGVVVQTAIDRGDALFRSARVALHGAAAAVMVDFAPERGAPRLGRFDIVDGRLELSVGTALSGRPPFLSNASVYTTR